MRLGPCAVPRASPPTPFPMHHSATSDCGQLPNPKPSLQASSPSADHSLSAAGHTGVCISAANSQVDLGHGDLSKPQFPDCQVALLRGPGEINGGKVLAQCLAHGSGSFQLRVCMCKRGTMPSTILQPSIPQGRQPYHGAETSWAPSPEPAAPDAIPSPRPLSFRASPTASVRSAQGWSLAPARVPGT